MVKRALVIDLGTCWIRIGIVGNDAPERIYSYKSLIGISKNGTIYYGNDVDKLGTYSKVKNPLLHPEDSTDKEVFKLLAYGLQNIGETTSLSVPCLCILPGQYNPQLFSRISFILATEFSFCSLSLLKQEEVLPHCILETEDKDNFTGIILSSGESHTFVMPVISGYPISDKVILSSLGGRNLSESLVRFLILEGCCGDTSEQSVALAECTKCIVCGVKKRPVDFASEPWAVRDSRHYYIQMGNMPTLYEDSEPFTSVVLPNQHKLISPEPPTPPYHILIGEILFSPTSIGLEEPSVPELVKKCIKSCDIGVQGKLWSNVLVIGGNTNIKGFRERFSQEITKMKPEGVTTKVLYPHERELSVWKAAAYYASTKLCK